MTPEQEALVEALRLFAADQGIGFDRMHNQMAAGLIEPIGEDLCDSTFSVTPAGRLVLALAAERDDERAKAATAAGDFVTMLERISRELNAALAETQEVKEKLRGEVELWRLRCEWQEACHKWERAMRLHYRDVVWDDEINRLEYAAVQAKAAYVAAGGVVLWRA